jgi:hypothetical protein
MCRYLKMVKGATITTSLTKEFYTFLEGSANDEEIVDLFKVLRIATLTKSLRTINAYHRRSFFCPLDTNDRDCISRSFIQTGHLIEICREVRRTVSSGAALPKSELTS